ncbi:MAG TPA: nitrile hydratase subunit alpha, partial [Rubrobacter sp.]|nr:nitrile hydratase subunit alpha [Rubrobacter sp.]
VVHDSTADVRYMVLPMRPPGTENLGEEDLAALVTRDSLVGVSVPRAPARTA